jgi:GNAT superfamily N-acetyltransferase
MGPHATMAGWKGLTPRVSVLPVTSAPIILKHRSRRPQILDPQRCPAPVTRLARRYVTWAERRVKEQLEELRLSALDERRFSPEPPPGVEILPLSACGDEWLLRRAYNNLIEGDPFQRPARWVDMLAFAGAPNHDRTGVFLARTEGRVVGTCVGRCWPDAVGRVYALAIHREYRRIGIARALLHHTLEHLCARGVREARLYVDPRNERALAFYQKHGFRAVAVELPAAAA